MKTFGRALTAIVLLAIASMAVAETYPERPVRVIVPIGAGGISDVMTRLVAQKLSENLGKQFYVENQVGAGGNIGFGNAAKAAPDGHTILAAMSTFMVNPSLSAKAPYDPVKDFAPVTLMGTTPFVLVVNPSVPAKDARELVAEIKANPGKHSYASAGVGTAPHLLGEMFRLSFGLDLVHVPFNGAPPAASATLAGHTSLFFATPVVAISNIMQGKLRAIAVTSKTRLPGLLDVPTVAEAGLPGEGADTMVGVLVPAGTPQQIVDVLNRKIVKIIALPEVKERFAAAGFDPVGNTPEEFGAYIKAEIARWAKVIRDAKIRSE